jgi:hypothetical protein
MKKLLCALLSIQLFVLIPVMAQSYDAGSSELIKNTRNDMLIVLGAGGTGAILGLSTLSFVERPGDNLRNVYTGAALGVIGGVIYVIYNSAQRGTEELEASVDFSTSERFAWHGKNTHFLSIPQVQFGTQIWQTSF